MANLSDFAATLLEGKLQHPPIAKLVGFELIETGPGRAVFMLQTEQKHYNPMGTVHGGILCDLADAAMGIAFATTLAPDETFTTLELKINFMKPIWETKLRAVGKVVKRGKTVGLSECDVFDAEDSLVARASSTVMVLRGEMSKGR